MASLRPCLLARRMACSRPWPQLERQFSSLHLNAAGVHAHAGASASTTTSVNKVNHLGGPGLLTKARQNSTASFSSSSFSSSSSASFFDDHAEDVDNDGADFESFDEATLVSVDSDKELADPHGSGWDRYRWRRQHIRPLPVSPSYFSRQPEFDDSYLRLRALFRRFGNLPQAPADEVKRVAWKSLLDYQQSNGERILSAQYARCIDMVKQLHRIHPRLKPAGLDDALAEFRRDVNPFDNVPRPLTVDRFGRAIGVGRRKTSVARAWVVEGTGEVLVNGKTLSGAFARVHDRESATWALRATERTDKYNVWALVEGGGTTGQAEALTLAVAKGLVAHEPALKTALRKAGCITRDRRVVERKKHGRVKARKGPAWVKR
ncbi:37S ribosomal protein s9 [Niveomyces insectorum RCEF 264]|uniref:Small ribosomal subunit protein uS9m n=1 Tax=Niveomyces insectorum RCEF 264 TaxID=1081102 RepID=A0A167X6U9_9HYPO|nr:37S ribosomal protein s9 [Niveomyces insectorum RCEF 264]